MDGYGGCRRSALPVVTFSRCVASVEMVRVLSEKISIAKTMEQSPTLLGYGTVGQMHFETFKPMEL